MKTDDLNKEAYHFAAHLLVPDAMLYRAIIKYREFITARQLATLFGVPLEVIKYRLDELEIIIN